jgi:phosphoribosylformylglycinamidine cyclo-ligase
MKDNNITYEAAGVDLLASEKIKERIKDLASNTHTPNVLGGVGGFGAMYKISGYRDPVLVSSTDPVGTKLLVAGMVGDYSYIGEDLVNACVNDLIVVGAEPLFFLDYIATSKLVPEIVESIVTGISEACKNVGCALIGGETSEMPGVFKEGKFDISGFVVGAVEADQMLNPLDTISKGDLLIGLPSNGLHTNGYSLVRHVFNLENDLGILKQRLNKSRETLGEALLKPHPSYYHDLKSVFPDSKGIAHITGGGLYENMPRILPTDIEAQFDASLWDVPAVFEFIRKNGSIDSNEMYRVFNMGLGMVIVCAPENASRILKNVSNAILVGELKQKSSDNRVKIENKR